MYMMRKIRNIGFLIGSLGVSSRLVVIMFFFWKKILLMMLVVF